MVNVMGSGSVDKMLSVLPGGTAFCFAGTDMGHTLSRGRLRDLTVRSKLRKSACPSMRATMATTGRGTGGGSFVFIKKDDFVITSLLGFRI